MSDKDPLAAVDDELHDMSKKSFKSVSGVQNTALWTIYALIVLYALCYQLQRPVEPLLVEYLVKQKSSYLDYHGQDARREVSQSYGRLESFFSAIQTLGSPLVGTILDKYGPRITFIIVYAACALSYGILTHAKSMRMLFISKIPTTFQHAFLVAQAAAASCTSGDAASRAEALGRMTTAYTIGSTLGPAVGGKIAANGDFYRGAYWAVSGSILCIILSWIYLPTNQIDQGRKSHSKDSKINTSPSSHQYHSSTSSLGKVNDILRKRCLWPYLGAKFCSGIASSIYQTTLPLVLTQHLHFNSSLLGLSMSFASAVVGLMSAFALKPLTAKVGTSNMMLSGLIGRLLFISSVSLAVTFKTLESDTSSIASISKWRIKGVILSSIFYSVFSHILATSMTTQTTGMVDSSEQGTLMGVEHGIFSIARIVGPPLGAYLYANAKSGSYWSIASSCIIIDGYLLYIFVGRFSARTTVDSREANE